MGQAFGRRLSLLLVAPIFATSFMCQAAAPDLSLFQACDPCSVHKQKCKQTADFF